MNKYQRLKHSARNSARRRGHNLTRFRTTVWKQGFPTVADASCKNCGAEAHVNINPLFPNIYGTAIELPCNGGQA